jgi:ABC-type glucose/galactose transport system permease subunit
MSRKQIQKTLVVFGVTGLIVLAGTELFVVRDLLAALLLFCVLLGTRNSPSGVLSRWQGVVHCVDLLITSVASLASPLNLSEKKLWNSTSITLWKLSSLKPMTG